MHWILQNGFFSETGWDELITTLERFGIPYSVHSVTPGTGELTPPPALAHRNVICIGSYSMRHPAAAHGWVPGVFDLFAQDFARQLAHWGGHLLNEGSVVSTVEEARFEGERMFVRPAQDTKHLTGRVFTTAEFSAWRARVCDPAAVPTTSLTPRTLIQLAKPAVIFAEYRFWIVRGEIVTQSLYKRGGQVIYSGEVDARLAEFVRERVREWSPCGAFVLDVCDCEHGMKIVEINTLNASAFYAADVQRLVMALEGCRVARGSHETGAFAPDEPPRNESL